MHADFAAVLIIRESALQPIVRAGYREGLLKNVLSGQNDIASWQFYLDEPAASLADPDTGGGVRLVLRGWGRLTLVFPKATFERIVRFDATARVDLRTWFEQDVLQIGLEADTTDIETFDMAVIEGGPWPEVIAPLVDGPALTDTFAEQIRNLIAGLGGVLPPLDLGFLGPAFAGTVKASSHRTLAQAIGIGIDVADASLTTNGEVDAIVDFAADADVALFTHGDATRLQFPAMVTTVRQKVAQKGATLDRLDLELGAGHIRLEGKAHKSEGAVVFSMKLLPRVTTELWLEAKDVEVDIEPVWWVTFLEVVGWLLGVVVVAAVIEQMIAAVRQGITAQMSSSQGTGLSSVRQFSLPGSTTPIVTLTTKLWDFSADGTLMRMDLGVRSSAVGPAIRGRMRLPVEELSTLRLRWSIRLPYAGMSDDPQLRVAWTWRRTDTNEVLKTADGRAPNNLGFAIGVIPQELWNASGFSLSVRIYRTLGPETETLFTETARICIEDVFDRSHPYVYWTHPVFVPKVCVEADCSHTIIGNRVVQRTSHIHRTAFPGRCRMASRFSRKVKASAEERKRWGPASKHPAKLEYLDALPFAFGELAAHRGKLCDYCFFGGPGKTTPIIDPY